MVKTSDAVVVVPGVMGSELVDTTSGDSLWSMGTILGYGLPSRRRRLSDLKVRDEEREGRAQRVKATRLLRRPAFAPFLGGIEPYGPLLTAARRLVVDPRAVLEFPYDWRLGVDHNGALLAREAGRHLEKWRSVLAESAVPRPDGAPPRLVVVAHSMGGLVARAAAPELGDALRAVVTLGTPFHGSVKVVDMLAHGRGNPLPVPDESMADLARTLPGLHDLLPSYRCVVRGADEDVVEPDVDLIASLGGDPDLVRAAYRNRARHSAIRMPGHQIVNGISQPTQQAFRVSDSGVVETLYHHFSRHDDGDLFRDALGAPVPVDRGGDGTVYRYAAELADSAVVSLVQQHQGLARASSALEVVEGVITREGDLGAVLGEAEFGLLVPDQTPDGRLRVLVTGADSPSRYSCVVQDVADQDRVVARPLPTRAGEVENGVAFDVHLNAPGLYRVAVSGGANPVTKLVYAGTADV